MRSAYDPDRREIHLAPDACLYTICHERAHEAQQHAGTRAWRILERTRRWPYVCRIANLAVEIEANAHALRILHRLHRLRAGHVWTALGGLATYVFSLFDPRDEQKQ